jgi:putative AdoMet-dependent methyltransferase
MALPEWQYDEAQHVGVDYASEAQVARYDERMARLRNFQNEVEQICGALKLTGDDSVLDVGTGIGEIAIGIAPHCRRVTAVDISPAMLGYAAAKAGRRGTTNIDFARGGFLSYEGAAGSFDAVVSQLALHHLPDFWKTIALARIHRLLKKGGRFYLKDVVFPSGLADYDACFAKVITGLQQRTGNGLSAEMANHIRSEFSTLDWIMEGMIERAGFHITNKSSDGLIAVYVSGKV